MPRRRAGGYRERGAAYAAWGRALLRCETAEDRLTLVVHACHQQTHPTLTAAPKAERSQLAAQLINEARDQALRDGVPAAVVRDVVLDESLQQVARDRLHVIMSIPLDCRDDTWMRRYAQVAPRLLLAAAPGIPIEQVFKGRGDLDTPAYTAADIAEVSWWGIVDDLRTPAEWWAFRSWLLNRFYPAYTRRASSRGWPMTDHVCRERTLFLGMCCDEGSFTRNEAA